MATDNKKRRNALQAMKAKYEADQKQDTASQTPSAIRQTGERLSSTAKQASSDVQPTPTTAQLKQEAMDAYLNREDFTYDFNADPLYQLYKNQYMEQGKTAMQDTMGQAAALTGGYGSSYAQNVGQQAYYSYLQELNDMIPELYQLAYDQYQDEGNKLLQEYGLLADEEAEEYARWYQTQRDAVSDSQWQKSFDEGVRQYDQNFTYTQERDAVADSQWQQNFDYQKRQDTISNDLAQQRIDQKKKSQTEETVVSNMGYDNGSVSKGNVKAMQRILGVTEDGYWGSAASKAAGGMTADQAWEAYQKGHLQQRYSPDTNPFTTSGGSDTVTVKPHTENTRNFIASVPSPAAFGGSEEVYKNYIYHQLDNATYLTDDELITLVKYYNLA